MPGMRSDRFPNERSRLLLKTLHVLSIRVQETTLEGRTEPGAVHTVTAGLCQLAHPVRVQDLESRRSRGEVAKGDQPPPLPVIVHARGPQHVLARYAGEIVRAQLERQAINLLRKDRR